MPPSRHTRGHQAASLDRQGAAAAAPTNRQNRADQSSSQLSEVLRQLNRKAEFVLLLPQTDSLHFPSWHTNMRFAPYCVDRPNRTPDPENIDDISMSIETDEDVFIEEEDRAAM